MSLAGPEDLLFSTSLASYLDSKLFLSLSNLNNIFTCGFSRFRNSAV